MCADRRTDGYYVASAVEQNTCRKTLTRSSRECPLGGCFCDVVFNRTVVRGSHITCNFNTTHIVTFDRRTEFALAHVSHL